MFHISELLDFEIPKYPHVVVDNGTPFLVLEDGREYKIENDPAAVIRLLNHLAGKSWTTGEFFYLATARICMTMGWWYPEDPTGRRELLYEGDLFTGDNLLDVPEFPKVVVSDDGAFFLAINSGREYELRKDPLSLMRLMNRLAEKSWADNNFFDLATSRICAAFGWNMYQDDHQPSDGEPFYLNKTSLLERGWTPAMINDFLGDPDDECFVPQYMVESKLYDYERVLAAESSDEWQEEFMAKLPLRVARSDSTLRELLHRWELAVTKHKRRATRHIKRVASND